MKIRSRLRREVVDRQRFQHARFVALLPVAVTRLFLAIIATLVCSVTVYASGRPVVFVDSTRAGGAGTYDQPFATLAQAARSAGVGAVIYVAEGTTPYEGGIALARGQMLVGSAYGLDQLRAEMHTEFEAPPLPAAKGTGPVIHGSITLAGDNVVAGCSLIADAKSGVGIAATSPEGSITLKSVYMRTANEMWGLYIDDCAYPVTWTNGRLDASDRGAGILINGGNGNITLDHVPIEGDFSMAVAVRGRSGGAILFHNASPVTIHNASREAVTLLQSRGSIAFDSPLQITTSGGRGFFADRVQRLAVTGGSSWIETTNSTALTVRDANADVSFDRVSASTVPPGKLAEGIVLEKVHGRFNIAGEEQKTGSGGRIIGAFSYGIRIVQSSGVHLRNLAISGGGTQSSTDECPSDIPAQTNIRCRAAMFVRHVEHSSIENIEISGTAGVGINVNNASDVTFGGIHVIHVGDQGTEPALLVDEVQGDLKFSGCTFVDGAGGGVVIEQRFNSARITFDGCEIAAPERPMAGAALMHASARGEGRLDLQLLGTQLHDNAGAGLVVAAINSATALVTLRNAGFARLGFTAVDVSAAGSAAASLIASGAQIALPAVVGQPLVTLRLSDTASGCADLSANTLSGGASPALIRLSAPSPTSVLRLVSPDAQSALQTLSAKNGGIAVGIDAAAIQVTTSCR